MFLGMAGTGGVHPAAEPGLLLFPGPGDCARNVLSVIEPELVLRCRPPPGRALPVLLALEAVDPRRIMRFVWISPTPGVGVLAADRRAAAAAAAERDGSTED